MEDKTPIVLFLLAGLAVAFLLWKRHAAAAATPTAAGSPGFGAALRGDKPEEKKQLVPLQAPVMRGGPTSSSSTRPTTTTTPTPYVAPVRTTALASRASTLRATTSGVNP